MPTKRRISIKEKIKLASTVRRIRCSPDPNKPSIKALARQNRVSPNQLRKWERQLDDLIQLPQQSNKYTLNQGRPSFLAPIKDHLLLWLSNVRQAGIPVSIRMLMIRAGELMPDFLQKTTSSKYQVIYRLLKSNGFSIRAKTRVGQASIEVVREIAGQFMTYVRPLLTLEDRDKQWILNMDQTAVFFSMIPRTTVNQRGARTVNVRDTNNGSVRITVAVSITAGGGVLKPFLVMKGVPRGRIERSFAHFPEGAEYAVQENAWMDESVMLQWIERVLHPWAEEAPAHIRPVLILDSYRCHTTDNVRAAIGRLGVDLIHIPGGCTSLCQPVDVGINKPFKNRLRNHWEEYLMENRDVEVRGRIPSPSREVLAQWVIDSLMNLRTEMVENAWKYHGFSYFDENNNGHGDMGGDVMDDDGDEDALGIENDDFIQYPNEIPGNAEEDGPVFIFNA